MGREPWFDASKHQDTQSISECGARNNVNTRMNNFQGGTACDRNKAVQNSWTRMHRVPTEERNISRNGPTGRSYRKA
jgi:hypothetical protein